MVLKGTNTEGKNKGEAKEVIKLGELRTEMYHKKNQTRIAKEWKNYRMKAYRCWGRRIKAFKEDSFKQC